MSRKSLSWTNKRSNKSHTLPFSHRRNIARLALNPKGNLLLSVDEDGHAILTNFLRRIVLHHFTLKGFVSALSFSPSGRYFAVGLGRLIEVWHTPSTPESTSEEGLEYAPFVRYHAHAGHHDTVQSIEWSGDSRFFLSASKDLTAKIWSLKPEEGFVPTTLAGHRENLLAAWFSHDQELVSWMITNPRICTDVGLDIYNQPRWSPLPMGICAKTTNQRQQ